MLAHFQNNIKTMNLNDFKKQYLTKLEKIKPRQKNSHETAKDIVEFIKFIEREIKRCSIDEIKNILREIPDIAEKYISYLETHLTTCLENDNCHRDMLILFIGAAEQSSPTVTRGLSLMQNPRLLELLSANNTKKTEAYREFNRKFSQHSPEVFQGAAFWEKEKRNQERVNLSLVHTSNLLSAITEDPQNFDLTTAQISLVESTRALQHKKTELSLVKENADNKSMARNPVFQLALCQSQIAFSKEATLTHHYSQAQNEELAMKFEKLAGYTQANQELAKKLQELLSQLEIKKQEYQKAATTLKDIALLNGDEQAVRSQFLDLCRQQEKKLLEKIAALPTSSATPLQTADNASSSSSSTTQIPNNLSPSLKTIASFQPPDPRKRPLSEPAQNQEPPSLDLHSQSSENERPPVPHQGFPSQKRYRNHR
ncbi:MAG: hypothetical protein A3I12_06180 [Gammaproteobacteria bacterium RIFCSPLOWO2_02_FULL_38_11]|nr:MAG: hypothetical protein A3I12_06180 [Gammaproteobacteria bacterium RIFCSPLOWO2_02_FULL_38_11]OGT78079.1 MAG: hypothetical protein A3G71_05450 [Gammaproteobacteria bacterium RIFCSPLOWO2_12_FULL_38_14]